MQFGLQTDICVLDFAKSFDEVRHIYLILRWYGITGEVNCCQTHRTQRVILANGRSKYRRTPQDSTGLHRTAHESTGHRRTTQDTTGQPEEINRSID